MAVATGLVSTQESGVNLLQDSMVIDMREEISMADSDESQFTTFLMKAQHGECTREKINWREKDYFPRLVTLATAYTAVTTPTSVVLGAGLAINVRKGDVLRNMASGECLYVTASDGSATLTCTRQVGSKAAQVGNIGDVFLIASNASPQGMDFPDVAVQVATVVSNYTQIFRHGSSFSRTARAINYYGRSEPDQESALKGIEHKRAIEYSGFWGARDQKFDANTGEPVGFAGGLVEYITQKWDVAGQITMDNLDNNLRTYLQKSSKNTVWFVSPVIAQNLSKLNRAGQGTTWKAEPQNRLGLQVDAYLSGVYGYEIPIVVKKDWNDFTTALKGYGGWSFLADMDRIKYRTLTGAGTKLLTNRQHPGADRVNEEWLTECTWEIRNPASHSIIYGVV